MRRARRRWCIRTGTSGSLRNGIRALCKGGWRFELAAGLVQHGTGFSVARNPLSGLAFEKVRGDCQQEDCDEREISKEHWGGPGWVEFHGGKWNGVCAVRA